MKFIKLEILNLASLDRQGGETINFEEGALGDSTIFSIVGPTGSGKSTILDAICLALYNRAPRYPRKKNEKKKFEIFGKADDDESHRLAPTDSRNILTRGKKDGYSKLTFLANNGDVYRAEWYVRFNRVKYESVVTTLYKITQKDGNLTEEQAEWDKLPQIIGLDYEQFLRTVLIAQGSFANFLTAKEEERFQLLEKLIGCEEMYANITTKIKQQKDEATKAYNQIAANFSAQEKDIIPEVELETLKKRIDELEKIEEQAKDELQKVVEAIAWYTTDENYVKNISDYETAFLEVEKQLETLREQTERLALHDATLPAANLYNEIKTAETKIANLEDALKQFGETIDSYEQKLKQEEEENLVNLQQKAKAASEELEQQRPHINKAREIKAELEGLKNVLNEKSAAKADAEKAKVKADQEVADNAKAIEDAMAGLKKADEKKNSLQAEIEIEKAKKEKALKEIVSKIEAESAKITDIDIDQLNADIQALLRTYTLMTSENWEVHRASLEEGKPCPLCGGKHHPYADQSVLEQVENELSRQLEEKKRQQKNYNDTKQLIDQLNIKKDAANKAINDYAEEAQRKVQKADKHVSDANTLLETEKGKTNNLKEQQEEKKKALADAEDALKEAIKKADEKTEALKQEIGDKDPDTYEDMLIKAKTAADNAVTAKNEAIGKMREQLKEVQGQELATNEQVKTESAAREDKQMALTSWLEDYNANNPEHQLTEADIARICSYTDNWEAIRSRKEQLSNVYTAAETTLNNETKARKEHQQKRPEQEKEALLARKKELDEMSHTELVDAKARRQRHEEATKQLGDLFKQKEAAEQLKTEWEQIYAAIGDKEGSTLRKIAQCYTLRFLIEHANVEIRKFNSRYELQQVKNSLGIRVIDHDRADDVRDTTSLSGGETFIVSLGLALGLSSLSSRNISFENLFIDEGFGTLDPDTLATVIDSLAMLQSSQGKKVGVISHTDTMSERITTQIRIIKNGNSGSSRIEIYP